MSEIVVQPFQSLDLIDTMSEYVGNNEDSEIIKAENVASLPSSTRGDEGIIEGKEYLNTIIVSCKDLHLLC